MSNDQELSIKTQLAIVVEAGLNAIPVAGGSLAALYFGKKQEQRFVRLERFYSELKEEVARRNEYVKPLDQHNPAALAEVIEEINEAVQADFTEQKRAYFKNCFVNALGENNDGKSDKRRFFISTLGSLTSVQIEILVALSKAEPRSGFTYQPLGQDGAADFNASLEALRAYGLVDATLNGTLKPGINWGEITLYSISLFGREFAEFCLHDT